MEWERIVMMSLIPVTLATAGLLGLIYLALCVRVSMARRDTKVSVGDGGGGKEFEPLVVAMRTQANFSEYVPLALILLGALELAGAAHFTLVVLALMLIAGRIAHPFGMVRPAPNPYRLAGILLTWVMILLASIDALVRGI
jgi:uncharacterized membrane protein YecN with MAPEG domain